MKTVRIEGILASQIAFGFSPVREALHAVAALAAPSAHAEQIPWIRQARKRLSRDLRDELRTFDFLFRPVEETFPLLWIGDDFAPFRAQLNELRSDSRAYADAVLVRLAGASTIDERRLRALRRPAWYRAASERYVKQHPGTRPMLVEFAASPETSHTRFCAFVERFHAAIVEPVWHSVERRLRSDIEQRSNVLATKNVLALLRTLGPDSTAVRGRDGTFALELPRHDLVMRLIPASRCFLVPSFFTRPQLSIAVWQRDERLDCRIVYPISGLPAKAAKIPRRAVVARVLASAGEPTRLRILELLSERDLSTRELAGFLKVAEPNVSRHLSRLLQAGLVTKYRTGYYVLYALAPDTLREMAAAVLALT